MLCFINYIRNNEENLSDAIGLLLLDTERILRFGQFVSAR